MIDEQKLVRRAQLDRAHFGRIYDLYIDRIYRYTLRILQDDAAAQDATAITFEKALRNIGRYKPKDGIGFSAWIYAIARNEAHNQRRKQRWLTPINRLVGRRSEFNVEAVVQDAERYQQLYAILNQLRPIDRDLIVLRKLEGFSAEEVATILNISKRNVYVRLSRAMDRLRVLLEAAASTEVEPHVS